MRTHLRLACALAGLAAAPAFAAGPFDGTWRAKPEAAKLDPKPQVWELADGTYACRTCAPPYSVAADGAFHAIAGHPYTDDVSVQIVDPHVAVISYRKGGKMMQKVTETVSDDGKMLTETFEDMSAPNGQVVTGKQTATRVAAGKAGGHALGGSWRYAPPTDINDAGLMFTLTTDGDKVRYEDPTGISFDAVMGGPAVAIQGDPGGAMVKMERLGARSVRETIMVGGKTTGVATITVSDDGKMLTNVSKDMLHGTTSTFIAVRS